MKELTDLLKKPVFVVAVGLLLTVAISALLVWLVVLPGLSNWQKTQLANQELEVKVAKISQNINLVKGVNTADREEFVRVMDIFFPSVADYLHFATLNEQIAKTRGVAVTSFTTGSTTSGSAAAATSPSVGPAAGSTAPVAGNTPTSSTGATTTPIAANSTIFVTVGYESSYENLENLLKDLTKLDRLVGVSAIVFTKVENSSLVSANVTFNLPLAQKAISEGTSDTIQLLTEADKKTLESIKTQIQYSATPASNPIGKADPFN